MKKKDKAVSFMSVDRLIDQYLGKEKDQEQKYGTELDHTIDPRPDLSEDSELWSELLTIANSFHPNEKEKNKKFCLVLHGMRCGGTRLRQGKNGWVLRPDIDPTGRVAWISQEEYEYFRDKYLKEWMIWLKFSLKRLDEKHPSKPAS